MIDLSLLRVLKYKAQYDKVSRFVPNSSIDKRTKAIVDDIGKYFTSNPEEPQLDMLAFRSLFFTSWHKKMSADDVEYYNKVLDRMVQDVPESVQKNMINALIELEYATRVANIVNDYDNDGEVDIINEIKVITTDTINRLERTTSFEFASYEEVEEVDNPQAGLPWPLKIMNETYAPIVAGDQFIVAARPGKGKTSLLTFICKEAVKAMPDNKCVVWFNNESTRAKILRRMYSSALGATNSELRAMKNDGTLRDKYAEAVGGIDRIRVYDVHGKSCFQLEEILESVGMENVGLIIFDMLDNVKFPSRSELKEHHRLEQIYQWSRELGVSYKCPVLATSQVSTEGEGLLYPLQGMLKESKTAKQGACDGILMLGSSEDPMKEHIRGISLPKHKSKLEGKVAMREEVKFDSDRGIFIHE